MENIDLKEADDEANGRFGIPVKKSVEIPFSRIIFVNPLSQALPAPELSKPVSDEGESDLNTPH
jgi:hypothetical protein